MIPQLLAYLASLLWQPPSQHFPPSACSHHLGGGWRLEIGFVPLAPGAVMHGTCLVSPNRRHVWAIEPRRLPGDGFSFCCN